MSGVKQVNQRFQGGIISRSANGARAAAVAALLAAGIVAIVVAGCGGAKAGTDASSPHSQPASSQSARSGDGDKDSRGYLKNDGDKDYDDEAGGIKPGVENDGRRLLKEYGREPSAAETQAMAAAVKSYFTAAANENGSRACSLLAASLASGLSASAGAPGSSAGCARAMSAMLLQQHAQLAAAEVATATIVTARVKGALGLAVLGFRHKPEGEILLRREGAGWRMDALTSSQMP